MLRLPVMQCEVEVLDNIDLAMYCLELSEKKKKKKEHNFDHDTVYSSGYHSI